MTNWLFLAIALGLAAGTPARDSGIQVTPDGQRVLVNKDVGEERWAIARNIDDDTVTGNVFRGDDPPLFVWCEEVSRTEDEVTLDCYGADACPAAPCGTPEQWPFIAQVMVDSSFFEPPGATSCEGDDTCEGGDYCEYVEGACGGLGACMEIPAACTREFDPVCGCNDTTYTNPCEAAAAGVSVAHGGPCGAECAGFAGIECDPGEYCDLGVGGCLISDAAGECTPVQVNCTEEFNPVCGCDGVTYGNGCEAAAAEQNIAHTGSCEEEVACASNVDCDPSRWCERPGNLCAGEGMCVDRPVACTLEVAPVCGCDDVTYSNECGAAAEGVGVAHDGECLDELAICGGIAGLTCDPDEYCFYPLGQCLIPDATGECATHTEDCLCPAVLDPVCGCDGRTYDNECEAACAGQSVGTVGECA